METEKMGSSQKPTREHVENSLRLDLRRMFSSGALYAGCSTHGTWQCTDSVTGRRIGSVGYHAIIGDKEGTLTLSHPHTDAAGRHCMMTYDVRLSSIPLHYGGRRWYVHCPLTKQRAQVLHKWEDATKFCHRTALNLRPTYATQRVNGSSRIIARRKAIRAKLRGSGENLFTPLDKPKRMRWLTFAKYATREAMLARIDAAYIGRLLARLEKLKKFRQWI